MSEENVLDDPKKAEAIERVCKNLDIIRASVFDGTYDPFKIETGLQNIMLGGCGCGCKTSQ